MQISFLNYSEKEKTPLNIYGNLKKTSFKSKNKLKELELAWLKYFIRTSPNKSAITKNILHKFSKFQNKMYLDFVHVTPSLKKIINDNSILGSSGGLGFAIYCSLLDVDRRPHNIVDQYINFQFKKRDLALKY